MNLEVDIYAFKMGLVLDAGPLCEGMSPENVKMTVVERRRTSTVFDVTLFGVLLGQVVYDVLGGWEWQPISR